jgi:hypothetical protein
MVSCSTLGLAGRVVYPQCSGADARSIYKVRGIFKRVQALHDEFAANGLISLNEIGVDPGLDHMSAVKIIDEVQYPLSTPGLPHVVPLGYPRITPGPRPHVGGQG